MIKIPITKILFLDIETVGCCPDFDTCETLQPSVGNQFKKYFDWFLWVISIVMTILIYIAYEPYFYLYMSIVYITTMFLLIKSLFDFNTRMKRWLNF